MGVKFLLLLVFLTGALITSGLAFYRVANHRTDGQSLRYQSWTAERRPAGLVLPSITVHDQTGRVMNTRHLIGRPIIVAFVAIPCVGSCAVLVQQIRGALDRLKRDIAVLAFSLHPTHPTAASARAMLHQQHVENRIHFVIDPAITAQPVKQLLAANSTITKQASYSALLVDRKGSQRVQFSSADITVARLLDALELL